MVFALNDETPIATNPEPVEAGFKELYPNEVLESFNNPDGVLFLLKTKSILSMVPKKLVEALVPVFPVVNHELLVLAPV